MSDYRAIAGVSRSLKGLLLDRMTDATVKVTIAPPDITIQGVSDSRLNLYLYQVTENGNLKNQEIPGQGHPASYGRPPLSLDLNYLATAYPSTENTETADLESQQILGDAMRVLHDFPIITKDLQFTRSTGGTINDPILDASLLNEFERIKITLQPLTLDELSKIWSSLPGTSFRRSVAYKISVVQIESEIPRRMPKPVKTRQVRVSTFRRPEITDAYRTPGAGELKGDKRVVVGQQLTIEGRNFLASATRVRLGSLKPIRVNPVSDTEIRIDIPDSEYPSDLDNPLTRPISLEDQLQPGAQIVEVDVQHETDCVKGGMDKGITSKEPAWQSSNHGIFMLVPSITSINPVSGTHAGTLLIVRGKRLFHEDYKSYVLAGGIPIEIKKPAAGSAHPNPTDTEAQVRLDALAVVKGRPADLIIGIQVNGAQSLEKNNKFTLT